MSAIVNDSPPLEAVPLQEVPPLPAATEPVNVYLVAPPRGGLNVIPLGWLAQLFGLDTAGDSMLTRRAALGMRNAAVVMLVVYIFDFCAWLLFFNSVFHSQDDVLKGDELTLLAGVFALLLSTATIIYERDFFCHDPDETRKRRAGALIIRLTVIAVTALATASTVDILLFRGPIRERIHQESVLSTLTAQWHKIEEQQKIAANAQKEYKAAEEQAKKEQEADYVKDTNDEVSAVDSQLRGAKKQLDSAAAQAQQLAKSIAKKEQKLEELDPVRSAQEIKALTQTIIYERAVLKSTTEQMLPTLQANTTALNTQYLDAVRRRDSARRDLRDRRDALQRAALEKKSAAERAERDLRVFIEKLKDSKPGETVFEFGDGMTPNRAPDGREGLVARDRESNFFDQVRIIRDLMAGADPKWSGIEPAKAEWLAGQFGIDYQAAKTDEKRAARQQNMFNIAVAGVTGIGFMIPLLILAMKLIAPLELRAYYSTGRQALAGNAEATLLRAVDAHYTARERRRGANGEDAT